MAKKKSTRTQSDRSRDDARCIFQLIKNAGKDKAIEVLRSFRLGEYDGVGDPTLFVIVDRFLGFTDLWYDDEEKFHQMVGDSKTIERTATDIHNQIKKYCIKRKGTVLSESCVVVDDDLDYDDDGNEVTTKKFDSWETSICFSSYKVLWEAIAYINSNFGEYGVHVFVPSADNDCSVQYLVPAAIDAKTSERVQDDIRSVMAKHETVLLNSEKINGSQGGYHYSYLFRHESDIFGVGEELRSKWNSNELHIIGFSPQVDYVNNMKLMKIAASIQKKMVVDKEHIREWKQKTGLTSKKYYDVLRLAQSYGLKIS